MVNEKKTLVIIGGGYAAMALIDELAKKGLKNLEIVLISQTNYFFHNVASPRALVDESVISKICIPYDMKMKKVNGRFIHARVVSMSTSHVNYNRIADNKEDKNESLNFDYLVLAFGCVQSHPFAADNYDKSNQISSLQSINEKLKRANRILLVGGGSVGSETAGEFATDHPNKKITLLTTSDRLVPSMDPGFSNKVLNILRQKNVEVIFNDRVDLTNVENYKSQKIKTRNGKDLEFDAYFVCVGVKPYKELFEKSDLTSWLNPNGFVKVNKYLQVADQKNVFAIGDCCDLDEPKMAYKTTFHAAIVAHNLNDLIVNGGGYPKEYKPSNMPMMLLTLGRDNGVLRFSCFLLQGFLPRLGKARDLFIPKFRKEMGYSP